MMTKALLLLALFPLTLVIAADPNPIASGYGANGPYAGAAITTFTINNPTVIGVPVEAVRVYVATTAPAGKRPLLDGHRR